VFKIIRLIILYVILLTVSVGQAHAGSWSAINTFSTADNIVYAAAEDKNGDLLVATSNGIMNNSTGAQLLPYTNVKNMIRLSNGNVFFMDSSYNFHIWNGSTDTTYAKPSYISSNNPHYFEASPDPGGRAWFSTGSTIYEWTGSSWTSRGSPGTITGLGVGPGNICYASVDNKVFKWAGGTSWVDYGITDYERYLGNGNTLEYIENFSIIVDRNNVLYVAAEARTEDNDGDDSDRVWLFRKAPTDSSYTKVGDYSNSGGKIIDMQIDPAGSIYIIFHDMYSDDTPEAYSYGGPNPPRPWERRDENAVPNGSYMLSSGHWLTYGRYDVDNGYVGPYYYGTLRKWDGTGLRMYATPAGANGLTNLNFKWLDYNIRQTNIQLRYSSGPVIEEFTTGANMNNVDMLLLANALENNNMQGWTNYTSGASGASISNVSTSYGPGVRLKANSGDVGKKITCLTNLYENQATLRVRFKVNKNSGYLVPKWDAKLSNGSTQSGAFSSQKIDLSNYTVGTWYTYYFHTTSPSGTTYIDGGTLYLHGQGDIDVEIAEPALVPSPLKLYARSHWSSTYSWDMYSGWSNALTFPSYAPNVAFISTPVSWSTTRGKSSLQLSWPSVPGASGYKLYLFDGNTYRVNDLGNVTSWDSRTAKVFPYASDLPENNTISTDPFRWDGSGTDFDDKGYYLYRSTVGTNYDTNTNYWFKVTAYNADMETGASYWQYNAHSNDLANATDTANPTGTIDVIGQEGLEKTFNPTVTVTVNANDSDSGIQRIELSNNGTGYTTMYSVAINGDGSTNIKNYTNSWSWDLPLGAGTKTVYARITDALGRQKVITDSIALADDMLPPSITLTINDGATATTSNNVTLTISVADNASTESQMQMAFSNNGNLWSPWESFEQTKTWDITHGTYGGTSDAGKKKVYCRIYDTAQNTGLASAEIGYNPNPPTGSFSITGGITGTYNGKSVMFVSADTPTMNINATGASKIRFDSGIGMWSDWEDYTDAKEIVLAKSSGVCLVRIQVKDNYGVTSEPEKVLVVIDGQAPVINSLKTLSGATATSESTIDLIISVQDNISKNLQYDINGGIIQGLPVDSIITAPVSGSGLVQVKANVYDEAGNKSFKSIPIWKL